jgi:hypothetical protein
MFVDLLKQLGEKLDSAQSEEEFFAVVKEIEHLVKEYHGIELLIEEVLNGNERAKQTLFEKLKKGLTEVEAEALINELFRFDFHSRSYRDMYNNLASSLKNFL